MGNTNMRQAYSRLAYLKRIDIMFGIVIIVTVLLMLLSLLLNFKGIYKNQFFQFEIIKPEFYWILIMIIILVICGFLQFSVKLEIAKLNKQISRVKFNQSKEIIQTMFKNDCLDDKDFSNGIKKDPSDMIQSNLEEVLIHLRNTVMNFSLIGVILVIFSLMAFIQGYLGDDIYRFEIILECSFYILTFLTVMSLCFCCFLTKIINTIEIDDCLDDIKKYIAMIYKDSSHKCEKKPKIRYCRKGFIYVRIWRKMEIRLRHRHNNTK